jgi:hypothetical protein
VWSSRLYRKFHPVLTNNSIRPNFDVFLATTTCMRKRHDAESYTGEGRPILRLTGFLVDGVIRIRMAEVGGARWLFPGLEMTERGLRGAPEIEYGEQPWSTMPDWMFRWKRQAFAL